MHTQVCLLLRRSFKHSTHPPPTPPPPAPPRRLVFDCRREKTTVYNSFSTCELLDYWGCRNWVQSILYNGDKAVKNNVCDCISTLRSGSCKKSDSQIGMKSIWFESFPIKDKNDVHALVPCQAKIQRGVLFRFASLASCTSIVRPILRATQDSAPYVNDEHSWSLAWNGKALNDTLPNWPNRSWIAK